ncbi:hypothetical protein [Parendozoicomonas haliclonae]|uniref:D-amino-acid oxidase n=1 Tax=Parendozoicomonas haliclonae TaxID=1960125 RepID=A0A1X7ANW4_9GAMM|nr:hypothetical protein [Parendozoicomonas haliclonae]SMA49976.1 FAD dependent oxidoreductase [Parendozoicomonas haliclonae]
MPDLATMIRIARSAGDIEAVAGQRHYSGHAVIEWDTENQSLADTPVFHAYGFGGAGLTLSLATAEYVAEQTGPELVRTIKNEQGLPEKQEVIVFGAGYVGIFSALAVRDYLDAHHGRDIPVRIISHAFPRGISSLIPTLREPQLKDNYSSMCAGGWVMPVSIDPHPNSKLWCRLLNRTQDLWLEFASKPPLNTATHMTRSLVFYDLHADQDFFEDKSGIRTVNQSCSPALYPEHPFDKSFFHPPLVREEHSQNISSQRYPAHYDQVVAFDNVLQTDTVSVLRHFTDQLLKKNITVTQTPELIENFDQLAHYFSPSTKTTIINTSGHGACSVFGCRQATPVRGDLVILKMPVAQLTENIRQASRYAFWAGGTNYVFFRYSLDGQWLEVVMGGTFLKEDSDLNLRPDTIRTIISFWLDFFHGREARLAAEGTREELIRSVVDKAHPRTMSLDIRQK